MAGLRNKYLLFILVFSIAAVSCSRKALSPEEYLKWVQDDSNELSVKKVIGDYEFIGRFLPPELLAMQDLGPDSIQPERLHQKKKEYEKTCAFVFKIATSDHKSDILKYNLSSANEFYGRLQYFTGAIQEDFLLACGGDTLSCSLCNFERTYSASPFSTFTLYFEVAGLHAKDGFTLIYNDKILGSGPANLAFKPEQIQNIPKLALQ